jgi:hypothetical protein
MLIVRRNAAVGTELIASAGILRRVDRGSRILEGVRV